MMHIHAEARPDGCRRWEPAASRSPYGLPQACAHTQDGRPSGHRPGILLRKLHIYAH
ncbi:MAG: hypothetical protein LKE40_07420 [Spirochaetia bacterium]|nr:hypothetical protein [Spirochaetia bacterium]